MANLGPLELELLESLLSGKTLTMGEKISTLDVLRSKFPDFLSNPIFNLTKENLSDNIFLIKYLTNPYNRNKIKNALRNELSLSPAQQIELTKALEEKPIVTAEAGEEADTQIAPAQQGAPAQTPVGEAANTMGLPGLPSAPSISSPLPRRIFITEQTTPPSAGKAGGTGQGTAATNKAARLAAKGGGGTVRLPYQATNAAKNFGSSANIFIKKGGNRLVGGLSSMLGGAGRALGNFGLKTIDFGARFSSAVSTRGSLVKTSSKKAVFIFLGVFLLFALFAGLTGSLIPPGQQISTSTAFTGSGCPDTSSNRSGASCHYLNPSIGLFDTTLSPASVDSYISRYSHFFIDEGAGNLDEFRKRVNYIVDSSKQSGFNPAIFLGYWKSESLFSTIGSRDMGCAGDNFYDQVDCALGINKFSDPAKNPIANCARSKDAGSTACTTLKSIRMEFDKNHPIRYPISSFDDFAESYGPYDHLAAGQPTNCTHTYNILIDEARNLNICQTILPTQGNVGIGQPGISGLVGAASQFVSLLSKGTDGLFNVKSDEPGFYYWCTALIIDAYNKVGLSGLSRNAHLSVLNMKAFFTNTQGYRLLPPNTAVEQLRVGDVIFFEGSGGQHVSLINSFDISPSGNGAIRTYDANNVVTEDQVFVQNHQAISAQTTSRIYSITGFGQATSL